MLTTRDVLILLAVCRYFVMNRAQVQRLRDPAGEPLFDFGNAARVARRRLEFLCDERFLNKTPPLVDSLGTSAPAYYPARRGCELLHEREKDERYLNVPTDRPQSHHVPHWLAVTDTHMTLDESLLGREDIRCLGWLNEWDPVGRVPSVEPTDKLPPDKRFRLYTLHQGPPKIACAPDAGFLLAVDGVSKVFYLEQDRHTSGVRQVAAAKTKGYAMLAETRGHLRHFPDATVETFGVLMVAPDERRRDALCEAIRPMPASALWRSARRDDLTPEQFLTASVWRRCDGQVVPLTKPAGGAA